MGWRLAISGQNSNTIRDLYSRRLAFFDAAAQSQLGHVCIALQVGR